MEDRARCRFRRLGAARARRRSRPSTTRTGCRACRSAARHRLRRASDHNTRSRALTELQNHLDLPEAPLRIECYDMAHLQGTDYVGSMVVLEDGLPRKGEYRRFKIKTVEGADDYASLAEVLRRRLQRGVEEEKLPQMIRARVASSSVTSGMSADWTSW